MHFCIQFFNWFLMTFSMFFLSEVQMCYNAETLKKLISHWFLQCFVKVAFFRTRQSKHQIFAKSIKVRSVFLIENWSKNRSKIDIFEHSESDPFLDLFWTPFWGHFGTILGAFGVPWGPLAPSLAVRDPPGPLPRGLLGSLGVLKSLQATFLIDFWSIWSHFGGPGPHFGGPGLHFGGPGAPFWMPWASFLPALGCDFYSPNP